MKEHAKKALKHDVSVAGKTIPTLAIAALFLVGTGSAALLSSFGTVSGTADVNQAVTLSDGSQSGVFTTDSFVAGQTVGLGTYEIQNNLGEVVETGLDTSYNTSEGSSQTSVPGAATSYIVYSTTADYETGDEVDDQKDQDISVNKVDPIGSSGEYAVQVTSGGTTTQDYAQIYFPVNGVTLDGDSTYTFTFDSETGSSNNESVPDEVYFYTAEGEKIVLRDSEDDGLDIDDNEIRTAYSNLSTFNGHDIVAASLGFGWAQEAFGEEDGYSSKISITVDDVRLTSDTESTIKIHERDSSDVEFESLPLGKTGEQQGQGVFGDYHYMRNVKFQPVTDFPVDAVFRDGLTVETTLDDAENGDTSESGTPQ